MFTSAKLINNNSKQKAKEQEEQKQRETMQMQDLKDRLHKTTEQLKGLKNAWKERETQFTDLTNEAKELKQRNTLLQSKQIKHDLITTDLENKLSIALTENTKSNQQLKILQQISLKEKKVLIEEIKKLRNIKSSLSNKYEEEKNARDDLMIQYEQKEYESKADIEKLQTMTFQKQVKHEEEMKLLTEKYQELNEKFSESKQNEVKFGSITCMGVWMDKKQRAMRNTFGRVDTVETPVLLLREELLKQKLTTGYIGIQDGNEIWYDFDRDGYRKYGQIGEDKARKGQNVRVVGFKGMIDVIGNGWMNAVYRINIEMDTAKEGQVQTVSKLHKNMRFDALKRCRVRLKNKKCGKYVVVGSNGKVRCNKSKKSEEGVFETVPVGDGIVGIKTYDGAYVSVDEDGCLEGLYGQDESKLFKQQKFKVLEKEGLYYGFQSCHNGKYVCGMENGDVVADREWCKDYESFVVEMVS